MNKYLYILIPVLLLWCMGILSSCEPPGQVESEKSRTLTPDERYIVELYVKINEIEENLQDNPEETEKKWAELRAEIDVERVERILTELEEDPQRWLAIYARINERIKRGE
jgi:hypothetical protein